MTTFITARLIKNDPGAVYEGSIYDRDLLIEHESGRQLRLFDHDLIGDHLQVGEIYEFVLAHLFYKSMSLLTEPLADSAPDNWIGEIVDVEWEFVKEQIEILRPRKQYTTIWTSKPVTDKEEEPWILVQTSIGSLLLDHQDIQRTTKTPPQAGNWLIWSANTGRYDLLGFRPVAAP